MLILAPFVFAFNLGRKFWMNLVRMTLMRSGPAFIKWGQWGATRPDLFPRDLCQALEALHNQAPEHSFEESKYEIERVFGLPLNFLFTEFDKEPVASGSIAQVHRAKLAPLTCTSTGLKPNTEVAVKIRHPGVDHLMALDFEIMIRACDLCSKLPYLSQLRLDESMRQFGGPFHDQLDLTAEADNLDRFNQNFRFWMDVSFPVPVRPFVTESVLIESFEYGDLISRYVKDPEGEIGVGISQTGLDLFLKMMVRDNFMHADMHPGNILVKKTNDYSGSSCSGNVIKKWLFELFQLNKPKLVLLDAGMITELTAHDQRFVVAFFKVNANYYLKVAYLEVEC